MARGTVSVVELHVEKAVLGLVGLVLIAMVWLYLIRSPNQIEYRGEKIGPDKLADAIRSDAEALRGALGGAKAPAVEVPDFSGTLQQQFAGGIFVTESAAQPPLPDELPLAAELGRPVPRLSEEEERSRNVDVVTPLPPSIPVAITGRSLVVRRPLKLAAGPAAEASAADMDEDTAPVELAWVSVAAYFPLKDQEDAMAAANYATHRSRVYLAGVEVQRQEMLANGEFSEWRDVRDSKAMPRVEVPEPEFSEDTGDLENDQAIRELYQVVKVSQKLLAQPEFYPVEAGDYWETPPLAGLAAEEEEPEVAVVKPPPTVKEPKVAPVKPSGGPTAPTRRPRGGGRGVISVGGGSSGGGGGSRVDPGAARQRAEAQKQIKADLQEARTALGHKEYDRAASLAERIRTDANATGADKHGAQMILTKVAAAKKRLERQGGRTGGSTGGGGSEPITLVGKSGTGASMEGITLAGATRPPMRMGASAGPTTRESVDPTAELVRHPERSDLVAIWFHDDSVQPGKTYRYRMRAKLWNRYVGKLNAVRDPEQGRHCTLAGEWSLPSDAVTVTPATYFFLAGGGTASEEARVEVWKWRKGEWLKQSFSVGIGDVVGGKKRVDTGELDKDGKEVREEVDFATGAVVLDIRTDELTTRLPAGKKGEFKFNTSQSLVLVYLDPADGQVKQRVQAVDRYDPIYQRLKDEYE